MSGSQWSSRTMFLSWVLRSRLFSFGRESGDYKWTSAKSCLPFSVSTPKEAVFTVLCDLLRVYKFGYS